MEKCKSKCYSKNTIGINPSFLNEKKESFDFCFDNILNEKSTLKCSTSNYNLFIPILSIDSSQILNQIYDIENWKDCHNYFIKYQNIVNKYSLERILKFSWETFFDSYKINIDLIIEIYSIFLKKINKNVKIEKVQEIIYNLKKNNKFNNLNFYDLILSKF